MKRIFKGKIINGKVLLYSPELYLNHVKSLEGKIIVATLAKLSKPRTNPQNKYYWGVVVDMIQKELGDERKEDTHDALRLMFLMDNSSKIPRLKSTTQLNTVEFKEYLESIVRWAASFLEMYIPDPNEVII